VKVDPGIRIDVFYGVYSPSDDSFLLLSSIGDVNGFSVLEVGTGTGIVALHCVKEGATVTAVDISRTAVLNTQHNAEANGLSLKIVQADLLSGLEGRFDLILFNPPYLSGEGAGKLDVTDKQQLVGGCGGYELTRRFLDGAGKFLAPGGCGLFLVSSETSAGVLDSTDGRLIFEKVSEKRIFFEELAVYRFTAR